MGYVTGHQMKATRSSPRATLTAKMIGRYAHSGMARKIHSKSAHVRCNQGEHMHGN